MIIGLTGGIGSGKSLVSDYLQKKYKFYMIKTDDLARDMMNSEPSLKKELVNEFGPSIYRSDGKLNRDLYASMIHSDERNRIRSDEIVHPAVWKRVNELIIRNTGKGGAYKNAVVESALPGEKLKAQCDLVIYVKADPETRIQRLIKDRGYSREYSESVIKGQNSEETYTKLSDMILDNSSRIEDLYLKIDELMEKKQK